MRSSAVPSRRPAGGFKGRNLPRRGVLLFAVAAAAVLFGRGQARGACENAGNPPSPVDVAVSSVPITVASTAADYFVLYVKHDLGRGRRPVVPVSLTRGKATSTPLTMSVPGLPASRYKVEKYQVASPADVDGDCKDDLTDPNPLSPAKDVAISDGLNLLSTSAEWTAIQPPGRVAFGPPGVESFVKGHFVVDSPPAVYFQNMKRHRVHGTFAERLNLPVSKARTLELSRATGLPGTDSELVTWYFWLAAGPWQRREEVPMIHSALSASMPIMAGESAKWRLAYYLPTSLVPPSLRERMPALIADYEAKGIDVLVERTALADPTYVSISAGSGVAEGGKAEFTLTAKPPPTWNMWVKVLVEESGSFLAADEEAGVWSVWLGKEVPARRSASPPPTTAWTSRTAR